MMTYTDRLQEIREQSTSLSSIPYREACDLLKQADAEIERMNAAMKRIIREAGMARKSQWITRADAIEHIMRLARYAEEALAETDCIPVASAGAPESLPPNRELGSVGSAVDSQTQSNKDTP